MHSCLYCCVLLTGVMKQTQTKKTHAWAHMRMCCISTASLAAAVASLRGTASSVGRLMAGRTADCFLTRVSTKLGNRSVKVLAFLMLLERRCKATLRPSRPEHSSTALQDALQPSKPVALTSASSPLHIWTTHAVMCTAESACGVPKAVKLAKPPVIAHGSSCDPSDSLQLS